MTTDLPDEKNLGNLVALSGYTPNDRRSTGQRCEHLVHALYQKIGKSAVVGILDGEMIVVPADIRDQLIEARGLIKLMKVKP